MSSKGRTALVVVCVLASASAGCVGFLTGSGPLEFSANETIASDAALAESGYSEAGNRTIGRTVNLTVLGQTRQVVTTSYLYEYNRSVPASALTDAAVPGNGTALENATGTPNASATFRVLATPSASVAGRNANPLASLSTEELIRRFLGGGGGLGLTFEGNRTVESLGAERTVSTYRAGRGDNRTALRIHAASFEYENDVVVVIAAHPASVEERDRVDTLIEGLEQLN